MSDRELLQDYVTTRSQAAFARLVERHVHLVYSAARRQVPSSQLAEDVTQSVFIDLSRRAAQISPTQPLAAWLFVVTRRTAVDAVRRESRRHAREQTAVEMSAMETPSPNWTKLKDVLDETMEALNESERGALLLRFFENRSLREVGETLGISEDTAQKRVSRALERLRTLLLRRGVGVTAAGLATDLAAHGLHTAPAALTAAMTAPTFFSAATLAPVAVKATQLATWTLVHKTVVTAATAAAVGFALHETSILLAQRTELSALDARLAGLHATQRQLSDQHAAAALRLQATRDQLAQQAQLTATDPAIEQAIEAWMQRLARLKQLAAERTELGIPELVALSENDWFSAAREAKLEREDEIRATFQELHRTARTAVARLLQRAINHHARAHDGELPGTVAALETFIVPRLPAAVLERLEMLQHGPLASVPKDEWILAERRPLALSRGDQLFVQANACGVEDLATISDRELGRAIHAFAAAHEGRLPNEPAHLLEYFHVPPTPAALTHFLARPASDFTPAKLQKLLQPE